MSMVGSLTFMTSLVLEVILLSLVSKTSLERGTLNCVVDYFEYFFSNISLDYENEIKRARNTMLETTKVHLPLQCYYHIFYFS